jgi:hypothetical protein
MKLRIISEEELKEILEEHKLWLETRYGNEVKGKCADLSNAYLRYANLENANLENADLYNADLYNANLENANLENTDLRYANLYNANLYNSNLENANLRYASLYNTNLCNANLYNADLENSNLYNANLDDKEECRKGYILKEDFIAYKKCRDSLIVKLCIPKGSIVFSINNKKCRTNRAKVLEITDIPNVTKYNEAISQRDEKFKYKVGEELEIDDFCLMYNIECESGIHFFKTREEAENC